jgi:1,4-alpha-glucan branching enzyme
VVRFVFPAPKASQVSIVGDFNQWDPAATPMVRSAGNGTWTVDVQLKEGRHVYAFVVDGKRWMADPAAPLAPSGFDTPNSVVLVKGASL